MRCIPFKAYQYKQPASTDGEFVNKLTCKALVRVFLERQYDCSLRIRGNFHAAVVHEGSKKETVLDFIRLQKLENSLSVNLL